MRIQSSPSLSALYALDPSLQVTANNIANVNTNEFQASVTRFETGPGDQGVAISDIAKDESPGALVLQPVITDENGNTMQTMDWVETSNTDLAREFTTMTATQLAWEANVAALRTTDEMIGSLINTVA